MLDISPGVTKPANDDSKMFDLAPVSLWVEDFSGVRDLFDTWRAEGVSDLRAYFAKAPEQVAECARSIRVVKVNQKTLTQFEAADFDTLNGNLAAVFRDDMLKTHLEELCQLWAGQSHFTSQTVNYTLAGLRLDVLLKGSILPGHEERWDRVLVSVEDITELESARHRMTLAEEYARGLFEHSPVSLWVEDFSAVKQLLDQARAAGISDFRVFTDVHPEFVERCMQ
ncbi:MAG: PAS domain-containing protein, partial [Burkholderia sp.]|nr:PAS domain-containing protein [Burkholderia sp.]